MAENAQERMVALAEERNALVDANAHLARQLAAAKGQITRLEGAGVANKDMQEVYDFWVRELGKKNTTLGPARAKLIRQAIKVKSKEDAKRAIVGLKERPNTGKGGRCPDGVPGSKRYDDIKYALGDEERIETFIGYADEAERRREAGKERTVERAKEDLIRQHGRNWNDPDRPRWFSGGLERVLHALGQHGSRTVQVGHDSTRQMAQCPAHDDGRPSLSVRECDDGTVLLHCFAGCLTFDVLTAMGLGWSDIGNHGKTDPDWDRLRESGSRAVQIRGQKTFGEESSA